MSIIADSYVFNTDTQLKASYQRGPADVTQIQITYKNTETWGERTLTITTDDSVKYTTNPSDTVLETITVPGNSTKTGKVLTFPAGNIVYVNGKAMKVRFDIPSSHCEIVDTFARSFSFEDDGAYGMLSAAYAENDCYGAKFGPTSDPNYPPQPVTLTIKDLR